MEGIRQHKSRPNMNARPTRIFHRQCTALVGIGMAATERVDLTHSGDPGLGTDQITEPRDHGVAQRPAQATFRPVKFGVCLVEHLYTLAGGVGKNTGAVASVVTDACRYF